MREKKYQKRVKSQKPREDGISRRSTIILNITMPSSKRRAEA